MSSDGAHGGAAQHHVPPLSAFTTLRVGGAPRSIIAVDSFDQAVQTCSDLDDAGTPYFILGGGSNLVVADSGVDAVAVWLRHDEIEIHTDSDSGVVVEVGAGAHWDDFVGECVSQGWSGGEALSGIPGTVGATPIQNVGAYGAQVSDFITSLQVWDRTKRKVREVSAKECGFGYRDSALKQSRRPDGSSDWVVLSVTFTLRREQVSAPLRYGELATALGLNVGDTAPLATVRETVLQLRAKKGMVLDDADHDTWSVGSFFINPIVGEDVAQRLPADAPQWPVENSRAVKISAAWLVEQAGFAKGFRLPDSGAAVSTKHALALTNRGAATAQEVLDLALAIRNAVANKFGVELQPEPVLLGLNW